MKSKRIKNTSADAAGYSSQVVEGEIHVPVDDSVTMNGDMLLQTTDPLPGSLPGSITGDSLLNTEGMDSKQIKKLNHQLKEKRRKEKTRSLVNQLNDLVPSTFVAEKCKSTNDILEKVVEYMKSLKTQNEMLLTQNGEHAQAEEILTLRERIDKLVTEKNELQSTLDAAGVPSLNWFSGPHMYSQKINPTMIQNFVTSEGEIETEKKSKTKKTKKNMLKNRINDVKAKIAQFSNFADEAVQGLTSPVTSTSDQSTGGSSANRVNVISPDGGILIMSPGGTATIQPSNTETDSSNQNNCQGVIVSTIGSNVHSPVVSSDLIDSSSSFPTATSTSIVQSSSLTNVTQSLISSAPIMSTTPLNNRYQSGAMIGQPSVLLPNQSMSQNIMSSNQGLVQSGNFMTQNGLILVNNQGIPILGNGGYQQNYFGSNVSNQQYNQNLSDSSEQLQASVTYTSAGTSESVMESSSTNTTVETFSMDQPANTTSQSSGTIQDGQISTLNTVPSQPNQLPSALILPNGQIIPVVTQPSMFIPQAAGQGVVLSSSGGQQFINRPYNAGFTQSGETLDDTNKTSMPLNDYSILNTNMPQTNNLINTTTQSESELHLDEETGLLVSDSSSPVATRQIPLTTSSTDVAQMPSKISQSGSVGAQSTLGSSQLAQFNSVQGMNPNKATSSASGHGVVTAPNSASVIKVGSGVNQSSTNTATFIPVMTANGTIILTLAPNSAPQNTTMSGTIETTQAGSPKKKVPAGGVHRMIVPKPVVLDNALSSTPTTLNSSLWNMSANSLSSDGNNTDKNETLEKGPIQGKEKKKKKKRPKRDSANDLLAQATESIFAEESPSTLFTASQEDNPLQIDMSTCVEEPDKTRAIDPPTASGKIQDSYTGNTVVTNSPNYQVQFPAYQTIESNITSDPFSTADSYGHLSKTKQKSRTKKERPSKSSKRGGKKVVETEDNKEDINSSFSTLDTTIDEVSHCIETSDIPVSTSTAQQKPRQKLVSPSRRSRKRTSSKPEDSLPETIEFSESEISKVLEQVESLGVDINDTECESAPKKKTRSRKLSSIDQEQPQFKKRKNESRPSVEKSAMDIFEFTSDSPEDSSVISSPSWTREVLSPIRSPVVSQKEGSLKGRRSEANKMKLQRINTTYSSDEFSSPPGKTIEISRKQTNNSLSNDSSFLSAVKSNKGCSKSKKAKRRDSSALESMEKPKAVSPTNKFTNNQSEVSDVKENTDSYSYNLYPDKQSETDVQSASEDNYRDSQNDLPSSLIETPLSVVTSVSNPSRNIGQYSSPKATSSTGPLEPYSSHLRYSAESLFSTTSTSYRTPVTSSLNSASSLFPFSSQGMTDGRETDSKGTERNLTDQSSSSIQQSSSFSNENISYSLDRSEIAATRTRHTLSYSPQNILSDVQEDTNRGLPAIQQRLDEQAGMQRGNESSHLQKGTHYGSAQYNVSQNESINASNPFLQDRFSFSLTPTTNTTSVAQNYALPKTSKTANMSSTFTFSLTSTTESSNTTSSGMYNPPSHHHYPFYPLHPSVTPMNPSSSEPLPFSVPQLDTSQRSVPGQRSQRHEQPEMMNRSDMSFTSNPYETVPSIIYQSEQPIDATGRSSVDGALNKMQRHLQMNNTQAHNQPVQSQSPLIQTSDSYKNRSSYGVTQSSDNYSNINDMNRINRTPSSALSNRSRTSSVNQSPHIASRDSGGFFPQEFRASAMHELANNQSQTITSPPLHHPVQQSHPETNRQTSHPDSARDYPANYSQTSENTLSTIPNINANYEPPPLQYSREETSHNYTNQLSHKPPSNTSGTYTPALKPATKARERSQKTESKQMARNTKAKKQTTKQQFVDRSGTPSYFPIHNLSPASAHASRNEGPMYFPSNIFTTPRHSLPGHGNVQHKPHDMNPSPFPHPFLNPPRPTHQNGLGIQFQPPSFGVNSVHTSHGSPATQITPHSNSLTMPPHVPSFSLGNYFDMNNSTTDTINISPIKFHHSNSIIPPPQEHPVLQHQPGGIYHNRAPPMLHNAMSINTLLGHNAHHGFNTRGVAPGMNAGMPSAFPGHPGHPASFGMPPLNFNIPDH